MTELTIGQIRKDDTGSVVPKNGRNATNIDCTDDNAIESTIADATSSKMMNARLTVTKNPQKEGVENNFLIYPREDEQSNVILLFPSTTSDKKRISLQKEPISACFERLFNFCKIQLQRSRTFEYFLNRNQDIYEEGLYQEPGVNDDSNLARTTEGDVYLLNEKDIGGRGAHTSRLADRLQRDNLHTHDDNFLSRHIPAGLNEASDTAVQIKIRDEAPRVFDLNTNDQEKPKFMMLMVEIQKIIITSHPLFVEEERCAVELIRFHEKYKDLKSKRDTEYYFNNIASNILKISAIRIQATRDEEKAGDDNMLSTCDQLRNLYDDIMSSVSIMLSLEEEIHEIYLSILKKWTEIVDVRDKQGFQCTNVSLTRSDKMPEVKSSIDIKSLLSSTNKVLLWLGDELSAGSTKSRNYQREVKVLIEMMEVIQSSVSSRYHLILSCGDERLISNISSFPEEQRRRFLIGSEKYFAKLFVNGAMLGCTSIERIDWSTWTVHLHQTFRCITSKKPSMLFVEIHQKRHTGFRSSNFICSTYLQIPGSDTNLDFHALHILTSPSVESYQFQRGKLKGEIQVLLEWKRSNHVEREKSIDAAVMDIGMYLRRLQGTRTCQTQTRKKDIFTASAQIALNNISMSFRMPGTRFCYSNSQRFQEPLRHHLIRKRESDGSTDTVPLEEDNISADMVKKLIADRKSKNSSEDDLVEQAGKERIFVGAAQIRDFVKSMKHCQHYDKSRKESKLTFEDIVHDESRILAQGPRANFSWILNSILPPRRRSLFPSPAHQTSNIFGTLGTQVQQKSRLIITIIKAKDVPQKEDIVLSNETPFLSSPPPIHRLQSSDLSSMMVMASSRHRGIPDSGASRRQNGVSSRSAVEGGLNLIVQMRFCGKTYETRPDQKAKMSWKQVIEIPLPFNYQNDGEFTPPKLKELDEFLEILLFDVVSFDLANGGGYYEDENTLFNEKRFLGSLKVPLCATFNDEIQQGSYVLKSPDIIVGYTPNSDEVLDTLTTRQIKDIAPGDVGEDIESQLYVNERSDGVRTMKRTALCMSVAVEPSMFMTNSTKTMITLPSDENPDLLEYAPEWMQRFTNKMNSSGCSNSQIEILFNGSNHKNNFVTRFLCSQPPPPECRASLSQCAHYVSLIPSLSSWKALKSVTKHRIWRTSQHILQLKAAHWNERAALLANYFMYLCQEGFLADKIDVYLVIGKSISEGDVIYVMTRKNHRNKQILLWNPSNGNCYFQEEELCPLISISLLVDAQDVYANLQKEGTPCMIKFDLNDSSCWQNFFGSSANHTPLESFTAPLPSIQEVTLYYEEPNDSLAAILESDIMENIKSSIRSWRRIPCSSFNNEISNRLRIIIDDLEYRKLNGMPPPLPSEYYTPLEGLLLSRGKHMFGFPLHFSLTSVSDILEEVKATDIHRCQHPEVEFSAAVRVFPYASNIFSVWIFLCSLVPEYK